MSTPTPVPEDVTREAAAQAAPRFAAPHRHCIVLRHGGSANHFWRNVAERESAGWGSPYTEYAASFLFRKISNNLRQGGVALINSTGEVVEFYSAPRLRTRW